MKPVAVILVNWNGWKDTCECVDSFSFAGNEVKIFIVDNNSQDGSVQQLEKYALEKNLSFQILDFDSLKENFDASFSLTIIPNSRNDGFAKANNLVLKFIYGTGLFDYAWLLNNDTVITADSLSALLAGAQDHKDSDFFGSVILDYYLQDTIQSCGVHHHKYLGVSQLFLKGQRWSEIKGNGSLNRPGHGYQHGAGLFVRLSSLPQTGLMDETFFLYSEEADWQIRGQKNGCLNRLCFKSVIYHKGSMSTAGRKHFFFFHYNRSAILMTRKNFGFLPSLTSAFSLLLITMVRSRLDMRSVSAGVKGIVQGWRTRFIKGTML